MGIVLLIAIVVGIALISNMRISDTRSDQQRSADEFEMDSYDDEEHWGDD